jgi:hypothetical protein
MPFRRSRTIGNRQKHLRAWTRQQGSFEIILLTLPVLKATIGKTKGGDAREDIQDVAERCGFRRARALTVRTDGTQRELTVL